MRCKTKLESEIHHNPYQIEENITHNSYFILLITIKRL